MIWRGRRRRFAVLSEASATIFLWTSGVGAIWFVLPNLAEKLSGSLAYVGLLLSLPALIAFLVDIPLGDLCDRADKKKIILLGLFLMFFLGFFLREVDSLSELVLFLVLLGVLHPIMYVATTAYVIEASPKKYSASFLGTYTSFIHLGFSVGALAGGFLIADALIENIGRIAGLYSIACVAAGLLALTLRKSGRQTITGGFCSVIRDDKVFVKELRDFRKLGFTGAAVIAMSFLFSTFDGIVWTLEPLLYQELSLKSVEGGVILAAFVVPLILFEAPAGYLADRIGKRRVLAAGLFVAGFFAVLFSSAEGFWYLLACAFMATTGLSVAWPATEGILAEHTRKSESGGFSGVLRT
ncbi:MAG: MFS transporter, partial [Candidatus Altiarchaeota archaeon]